MTGPLRWLIPSVLAVVLAVGIVLVVTGGDNDTAPADGPGELLDLSDTTISGVARMSSLPFPSDTQDFLTAQLDDGTQLDVTFTLDPDDVEEFVADARLPVLEADQRVITHSSPLWELTPEGAVRGTSDQAEGLVRLVEFVEEGERSRARVSVRPVA